MQNCLHAQHWKFCALKKKQTTEVPILYCRSLKPEVLRNHCTLGGKESKNEMYFMVVKIISYFLVVKVIRITLSEQHTRFSVPNKLLIH